MIYHAFAGWFLDHGENGLMRSTDKIKTISCEFSAEAAGNGKVSTDSEEAIQLFYETLDDLLCLRYEEGITEKTEESDTIQDYVFNTEDAAISYLDIGVPNNSTIQKPSYYIEVHAVNRDLYVIVAKDHEIAEKLERLQTGFGSESE